ncbi:MAG TPA: hypothetical protein PLH70_00210 [Bacteroidales bacterium]|nr:hypothetical protein [Bacteroidales bacterium]HOH21772.1 hypothetical protein [Bacteroidales bacterium]HPB58005.1 hypothetical protein [Bacteroidales bacterium]HPZ02911.1 hypothetical protein [Bacteroidales bacterium]HQB74207.1 hypothetical protein [Bacteroidales bacterium]
MDFSSKFSVYDFFSILVPGLLISVIIFLLSGNFPISSEVSNNFWFVSIILFLSYLIGLLWHRLLDLCFYRFRNNARLISEQYKKLYNKEIGKELVTEEIHDKYYKAYYFLMKKNSLNNIPNLEIKVAFIRNIIGVIPFYIAILVHCDNMIYKFVKTYFNNTLGLVIILIILFIGLFWLLFYYQNKIYYLVWEGKKYLKSKK